MSIHPSAVVSPSARIGRNVEVGPFCVIEGDVTLGDNCKIASHAIIRSDVELGDGNSVCEGAVLGGHPQHVACPAALGRLVIGNGNTIREHVTMHRALRVDGATTIGDGGYFMVGCHVGHDCEIGNNVILANDVLLGGHVSVGDRAVFGGAAAVHQFCRIGRLTMVGGMARVNQDVPPFVTLDGGTTMAVGLNRIGLRRAGFPIHEIQILKSAYRLIYRSGLTHAQIVTALRAEFTSGAASEFAPFLESGKRGFVQERRTPPGATVRIFEATDAADTQRRAG